MVAMKPMSSPNVYQDAHLTLDFDLGKVYLDTQPLTLTRKEFELLAVLVKNAGQIVSRGYLLEKIWSYNADTRTRTLDVHIRRLRRKLGGLGSRYIETVFGVGYRFQRYTTIPTVLSLAPATSVNA